MSNISLDDVIMKNELGIKLEVDISQCGFDIFKLVIEKIKEKKQEAIDLQILFERIMNKEELGDCFHYIIEADLQGLKKINLSLKTCNTENAKKLEEIGFKVKENRNIDKTLCGYLINWE